jgi:hypothetical protein
LLNYLILGWSGRSDAATLPDCSDGANRHWQCVDIRHADATSPLSAAGDAPIRMQSQEPTALSPGPDRAHGESAQQNVIDILIPITFAAKLAASRSLVGPSA